MPWVEFNRDFDWHPTKRATIAFKAGMRLLVTRRAAEVAVAKGYAELIERPKRDGT